MVTKSRIEQARSRTLLIVLVIDVLLIVVTMLKSHPSIWSEFDGEMNIWTFGNAVQMVLVSVAAYANYLMVAGDKSKRAWVWAILALVFLCFAFDDMQMLHERGGHAIEGAAPFLSRQNIVLYMDDLLALAYTMVGAIFGLAFLKNAGGGRKAIKPYMLGIVAMLAATMIGLSPSVKTIPFPLAVIQILQLVSVYCFLIGFLNSLAENVGSASR